MAEPSSSSARSTPFSFDLDGVLTDTASLHEAARTAVFADLFEKVAVTSEDWPSPFTEDDYRLLVDSEARLDGCATYSTIATLLFPREIQMIPLGSAANGRWPSRTTSGSGPCIVSKDPGPSRARLGLSK